MKEKEEALDKLGRLDGYSCLGMINFVVCGVIGFVLLISSMFAALGGESLFGIYWGDKFVFVLIVAAVVCAVSPFYLMFIKRRRLKVLVMGIITAVFLISLFTFYAVPAKYFSDFTPEKWLEYPQARNSMLDDLIEHHGIIGMDEDGVVELLGEPDAKNNSYYSYYIMKEQKDRMYIHVAFANGKVVSVTYHFVT